MAVKQMLLIRAPDKKIPEQFKQKLFETYKTGLGYASPQEERGVVDTDFFHAKSADVPLAEVLEQLETNYANDRVFYYFVNADDDDEFDIDSMQPFEAMENGETGDAKEVYVAVMLAGDFTKYNPEGESPQTNDHRLMDNFLFKKISSTYEMFEGNDKWQELLMNAAGKKVFIDEVKAELEPGGMAMIIPATGTAQPIVTDNLKGHHTFDWGYVTNTLGYTEGEFPAKEGAKATGKKVVVKSSAGTKPADPPASQTPPWMTEAAAKNPQLTVQIHADGKGGRNPVLWCKPGAVKLNEAKNWWTRNCQDPLPKDKDGEVDAVAVHKGFPFTKLKNGSGLKDFIEKLKDPGSVKGTTKEADSKQADVPAEEQQPKEKKDEVYSLLIPHNQRSDFVNRWKKGIYKAANMAELEKTQKDYPPATSLLGITLDEFRMLKPEAYGLFAKLEGDQLVSAMMHELRMATFGSAQQETEQPETPAEPETEQEQAPPPPAAKKKIVVKKAA